LAIKKGWIRSIHTRSGSLPRLKITTPLAIEMHKVFEDETIPIEIAYFNGSP